MKTKKGNSERPGIETLKRGHRVTPERHAIFSKALDVQFGMNRPRVGRPPMGPLRAQGIHIRIPPRVLKRLRVKAEKMGVGYQTLINQILSRAA